MEFLIEMLEKKKEHLLKAIQYLEAGIDDSKVILKVGKEVEKLEKRIQDLKDMCIVGKNGKLIPKYALREMGIGKY